MGISSDNKKEWHHFITSKQIYIYKRPYVGKNQGIRTAHSNVVSNVASWESMPREIAHNIICTGSGETFNPWALWLMKVWWLKFFNQTYFDSNLCFP